VPRSDRAAAPPEPTGALPTDAAPVTDKPAGDAAGPDAGTPDPAKAAAVKPDPAKSDPAKSNAASSSPTKPGPASAGRAKPDPANSDAAKSSPGTKPDEPVKPPEPAVKMPGARKAAPAKKASTSEKASAPERAAAATPDSATPATPDEPREPGADTKPADTKPADTKRKPSEDAEAPPKADKPEKADDAAAPEAVHDDAPPADDLPSWARPEPSRPGPGQGLPGLVAAVLAAASGTAMLAAFPPYGWWWLAPVAVALLAIATRGQRVRRGAWLGALHGAAFFTPLLHWTGLHVGPMPWLLLAGLQTLFLAILGAAAAGSTRFVARLPWTAPLVTAVLWVAQEALRSRAPFGGFPWGRIAFSQADSPFLLLASLGGAPLVTFVVALSGGLLAVALDRPWRRDPGRQALRALVFTGAAAALVFVGLAVPLTEPTGTKVTVAIIQGNVPRLGLDFNAQRRQVLENHVDGTRELARRVSAGEEPQPDLVIWPENSSDIDPLVNTDAGELINTAAAEINAPILVGAVLEGPGRFVTNAAIVWDPSTGPGEQYAKRHPVPFAEYVPMRSVARAVSDKVDLVRRDFKSGDKVGALRVGPAVVGDVICFEVAYDSVVKDTVTEGAELIVVQTNNATFDKSAESAQQLAMVRLRAVEHGRAAIMSSTSGVSATVTARGEILDESELFTKDTFVRAMRLGGHRTLATTLGGWPEAVLSLSGVAVLLAAGWLRWRVGGHSWRRRSVEPAPEPDSELPPTEPEEQEKQEEQNEPDVPEKQKEKA
jgi:apolipoprotein N-acyltransferase